MAVEKLKKTAEVLLDARGSLLPAKNDIQKTLGECAFPRVWSYMSVLNASLIVDTEMSLASIFCVTLSFHCEMALLSQGRGTPSLAGVLGSWEWGLGFVVCIPKF